MRQRAERLFPLFLVGIALGVIATFASGAGPDKSFGRESLTILCNLFMLPSATVHWMASFFPTNSAAWSLFLEYWVANLAFTLGRRWFKGLALLAVLAVALISLAWAALHYGGLNVGWSWFTLPGGCARVFFSFFAGVWLWRKRAHDRLRVSLPSWLVVLLLTAILWTPRALLPAPALFDLVCVIVAFPLLILLGAGAVERRPWIGAAAGELSYAVYIIHAPLLQLLHTAAPPGRIPGKLVPVAFTLAVGAAGYLIHHRVDPLLRRAIRRVPGLQGRAA